MGRRILGNPRIRQAQARWPWYHLRLQQRAARRQEQRRIDQLLAGRASSVSFNSDWPVDSRRPVHRIAPGWVAYSEHATEHYRTADLAADLAAKAMSSVNFAALANDFVKGTVKTEQHRLDALVAGYRRDVNEINQTALFRVAEHLGLGPKGEVRLRSFGARHLWMAMRAGWQAFFRALHVARPSAPSDSGGAP